MGADRADPIRTVGRRQLIAFGLPALAVAVVAPSVTPAAGAAETESAGTVVILRTLSGLEALAISLYEGISSLPAFTDGSVSPELIMFVTTTAGHHLQHQQALGGAITRLGGVTQETPNAQYLPIVTAALAQARHQSGPAAVESVVAVAAALENVLAATYVAHAPAVDDPQSRQLVAATAGVEAQHESVLLVLESLAHAGSLDQFVIGPAVSGLSAQALASGVPEATYPITHAIGAKEVRQ